MESDSTAYRASRALCALTCLYVWHWMVVWEREREGRREGGRERSSSMHCCRVEGIKGVYTLYMYLTHKIGYLACDSWNQACVCVCFLFGLFAFYTCTDLVMYRSHDCTEEVLTYYSLFTEHVHVLPVTYGSDHKIYQYECQKPGDYQAMYALSNCICYGTVSATDRAEKSRRLSWFV